MADTLRHLEWLEMAKKDIQGAEILFDHDADNGIICFHCQQSIEKSLKGFLIFVTGVLHDGHSLVKLCKKAANHNALFSDMLKDMAFVNTYYIETRYPAEDPLLVSKEDAAECMA
ncbi:MAG TPA: HEPN domain-containing protein, partial [Syntrophomonas sp.]|nr:HEPN domain-containing protein [Syntrophomonas sp.]